MGISTLGQALAQIERINGQQRLFDDLATQLTSGKKTQQFTGLGNDALLSQRARADFSSLDSFIGNIDRTDTRINLTLDAIEEFKAQAGNFLEALIQLPQESSLQQGEVVYYDDPLTSEIENIAVGQTSDQPSIELQGVQDLADNLFDFVADLLNVQDGDRFLLHGSETLTQPYNNNGVLGSAISQLVSDWRTGPGTPVQQTDALIADLLDRSATTGNPNALTDTLVGYSAPLSQGTTQGIFSRVSESSEIDYTALANETGFRDVLVALSYFRNEGITPVVDAYIPPNVPVEGGPLPPPSVQGSPGATIQEQKDSFFAVVNALTGAVSNALDDIDQTRFKLEGVRAQIDEVRNGHVQSQAVLLNTISDVEDANINEVALQINALQVQLDASFRVTATISQLSLTNFI